MKIIAKVVERTCLEDRSGEVAGTDLETMLEEHEFSSLEDAVTWFKREHTVPKAELKRVDGTLVSELLFAPSSHGFKAADSEDLERFKSGEGKLLRIKRILSLSCLLLVPISDTGETLFSL